MLVDLGFDSPCRVWTGSITYKGYGRIVFLRKNKSVHVVAWELKHGPIPTGLQIDHKCRVRRCFNTDHLDCVTPQVNTLRGVGVGAVNAKKTECLRGHPFSGENVIVGLGGRQRKCRTCRNECSRLWRIAKKEEEVARGCVS